jgi:hypothetical protein
MLKRNSKELLHATKIPIRLKILISMPVVTLRSPLGILPFLTGRPCKAKKKMKYDPSVGLVQTVQSAIRQEISGEAFFRDDGYCRHEPSSRRPPWSINGLGSAG